jgi:anti-anti-sigma factor
VVVSLSGEHDLATADELSSALERVVAQGEPLVVDLSDVGFIDSSTLHVLVSIRDSAARRRVPLVVELGNNRHVEQLFRITNLFELLCRPSVGGDAVAHQNGS